MPNHSGPNTNESGLVFSFDVNDYNSFKGQPGTNLGSGPNFGYSSSGLSEFENGKLIRWKSVTEKVHIPTLGVKDVKTIEWYNVYSGYGTDGNYTCCPTIFTYSPNGWNSTILEPSTEYMYQIIYKSASGYTHPNYMYHYERSADDSQGTEFGVHSTGRRTHLGDGWYHAWGSFTTQSYTVKGYFGCWHYEYNTKNKVSLAAVSLVKGNTVRPPAQFIDEGATLGNTEALLDLTGNTTINLSNVSFDTDAQMIFDGTDDNLDADIQLNYGNFSVEIVASWNNLNDLFCAGSGVAGAGLTGGTNFRAHMTTSGFYVALYSPPGGPGGWNNSSTVSSSGSTNTRYHITVVNIGTVWYFYKNGVLAGSVDALYTPNSASTRVGIFRNHVQSVGNAGEVFSFKAYNRALTASEVASNYNAVKSRFNI